MDVNAPLSGTQRQQAVTALAALIREWASRQNARGEKLEMDATLS